MLAALPLLLAVPVTGFSFLIWRFACYENCALSTTAELLRYALLGCATLFLYCAGHLALAREAVRRREALLLTTVSLVLWCAVMACFYAAAPKGH